MIIHLLIVGKRKFNNKTKDTYTDQVTVESFLELQEKQLHQMDFHRNTRTNANLFWQQDLPT